MYAIVIKVLTEDFKKDIDCLKPETELKKDLNLDSLDRVDFLCAVEAEYGDDVFDEDEDQDADTQKQRQQEFYTTKTIDSSTGGIIYRETEVRRTDIINDNIDNTI